MTLKQKTYNHFLQVIQHNTSLLQQVLSDLKESSANESRSTAGDKHETALAMLQIEQANVGAQLQKMLEKKAILEKINPVLHAHIIVPGSLIRTNRGHLFLSVALGKATIDGIGVTALSAQSPLGAKLMGLSEGDIVEVNNASYLIERIE